MRTCSHRYVFAKIFLNTLYRFLWVGKAIVITASLGISLQPYSCGAAIIIDQHKNTASSLDKEVKNTTYAFVVGINRYQSRRISTLTYAEPDAKRVYEILTNDSTGIAKKSTSVLLLGSSATGTEIRNSLRQFKDKLKEGDTLIIYWSGNAAPVDLANVQSGEDTALAAFDSEPDDKSTQIMLARDLLRLIGKPNTNIVFIGDTFLSGRAAVQIFERDSWRVSVLSASKSDELVYDAYESEKGSPLALGFQKALGLTESDLDGDGYISLEEAYIALYPQVVTRTFSNQHPSLYGNHAHQAIIAKAALPNNRLSFVQPMPPSLWKSERVKINDREVLIDTKRSTETELVLLGNETAGIVGQGMTYLETAREKYIYWRAGQNLQQFSNPYRHSFAIIVAINDYDRQQDTLKRGPTGYQARGFMVQRAKELKAALTRVGFPASNIIELYDFQATSTAIDTELKKFWKGGEHQHADRVFFYFGGHGDTFGDAGVLVSYDFDKNRPTQTGFLMRDLTTRHSENMIAKHVLFALDACASGLAVYTDLGESNKVPDSSHDELSIIRNDTEPKARNFLVAGTGDQPAIWDKGGIFTQALIAGLSGKADITRKRFIQFRALAQYVSNEVAMRAGALNVKQQVEDYSLTKIGTGRMLFLFDGEATK